MKADRRLALNAAAHLLVDGLCAATVFGKLSAPESLPLQVLVYNTLAFSTQCLVGLAADRLRRDRIAAAVSMLCIVLGWALPCPDWARIALIGLGNSVFHVSAGRMTLLESRGRAAPLGVFVAPGAVGLTLGTLYPRLGAVFAGMLTICAVLRLLLPGTETSGAARKASGSLLVPVLLTAAVMVRAIGGSAVSFPWKSGAAGALLLTAFVFAGKLGGGFLSDRIGARRTAWLSIPPAAVLTAFCAAWAAPSLLGQLALNLTMPVTLWLLWRAMPDAPGLAFGLTASALWPGMIAGQLMTLTGPALWACVLVSFGFGLCAILYTERKIEHETDR